MRKLRNDDIPKIEEILVATQAFTADEVSIAIELLETVWPPLVLAVLSGCLILWAWTVLWHAGLVRWFYYSGRRNVPLAEVLSRGLFGWWRWARLGLTSTAVVVLVHIAVWMSFVKLKERASVLADDSRLGIYLESGILLCLLAAVAYWLAGLRGAWLLGESARRSAVDEARRGAGTSARREVALFGNVFAGKLLTHPEILRAGWLC